MKKTLFAGVATALVTPFFDDKINFPMLKILIQRQIDAGISNIVLAGTTGEAPTLTDEEKIELFRKGKEFAGNQCNIIAGTGSNSTQHAIALSIAAEKAGVDSLLVVSPYYNKTTPEGLYAHYASIAQNVSIPIIIYNVPSRTGLDIPVSVYQQLAALPNIKGIKEASADITKISKIRSVCPDLTIYSGNDEMIVPVISLGGKGVISVLSNIYPELTAAMTDAALAGDFDTAAALQCSLQPVIESLFCEVNPIPVKEAMSLIGYDCGSCRPPLTSINEQHKGQLINSLL